MNQSEQALRVLVEEMSVRSGSAALLGVAAPAGGLLWRGAAGRFERTAPEPVGPRDGFRIASMSKVFTAVLVLQEVEAGRVRLDDTLAGYLAPPLLERLHPQSARITVEHLLNHTAGLWDFALSRAWFEEISRDPGRFRDPAEILEWAVSNGEPVGEVGAGHVYSDTGFVILGRMLETLTGASYAALCRSRIFEPLNMTGTWLEGHEPPCSTLSHCYMDELDALAINGSADWAAGGHVSTLEDLDRFLRGLFQSHALLSDASLDRMVRAVRTPNHQYGLGLGIRREQAPGRPETSRTLWGHSGHWGSFMFYLPGLRATVCGTVNRAGQDNRWIFERLLECLLAG